MEGGSPCAPRVCPEFSVQSSAVADSCWQSAVSRTTLERRGVLILYKPVLYLFLVVQVKRAKNG